MKTKLGKFLSVMLTVLVILCCTGLLFACHKDKNNLAIKDAAERAQSVANVKHSILNAVDGEWKGEMSDDEVAKLDNAGDYVIAAGWADFICDVFKASALQTGKLKSLDGAVASDDGQKLLADFNNNFELLIPLMRTANFTSTDISNLFYDLLCSLVDSGDKTLNAMSERLGKIKGMPSISITARENVQAGIINIDIAKSALLPTEQEKQNMLKAFADAKAPMSELVAFAYNISIGTISDNVFDVLFGGNGALQDISDDEIKTIVNAVLRNLTNLKRAFDDKAIDNMNRAMELVIANFDTNAVSSSIYQQVVQYAKYTYKLVGLIPVACDVLYSAGGIFADSALLTDLREVLDKDLNVNAQFINTSIITAKILLKIGQDFTKVQLVDLINQIAEHSEGDYQKKVPLLALDLALNVSAIFGGDVEAGPDDFTAKHDILETGDFKIMLGAISLTSNLDRFKQTYADYKNGTAAFSQLQLAVKDCNFEYFGVVNNYDASSQTESWYNFYVNTGVKTASEKINALIDRCVDDIVAFVDDFYKDGSESKALVETIANTDFSKADVNNAEFEQYNLKLVKSDIYGIVLLLALFPSL